MFLLNPWVMPGALVEVGMQLEISASVAKFLYTLYEQTRGKRKAENQEKGKYLQFMQTLIAKKSGYTLQVTRGTHLSLKA